MKSRAIYLAVGLGLGWTCSSFAAGLTNETIVGSAVTDNTAAATNQYAVVDTSGDDFFILNSSVSSANGTNKVFTANLPSTPAAHYAAGRGGVSLTGTTARQVGITDSKIAGGKGGSISTTGNFNSGNKTLNVNGGVGLRVQNGTIVINNSSISGGDGGVIDTQAANAGSTASGGAAIILSGSGSLTSTNAAITGGDGGRALDRNRDGLTASAGAGIRVSGGTQVINLVDTEVAGGDGGTVLRAGTANGAAGLLITGGADVTVQNGIFTGGAAGNVNKQKTTAGAAIEVQGSTVTFEGGTLNGNLLLSSGTSTLALKDTFDGAAVVQSAGTSTFNEWYDGQLMDVTLTGGTMNFTGTAFNMDGAFKVTAGTAVVNFDDGLTIMDGGALNLGLATANASGFATTEEGSRIDTSFNGTAAVGKIATTGSLTLGSGTEWYINGGDNAVADGRIFTLATATGGIVNNMATRDAHYVGSSGQWGWLGDIITLAPSGNSLQATYGALDMSDALGVQGDTSTEFGKVMNELETLIPKQGTIYENLGSITPSVDEARLIMENGYTRTPEMGKVLIDLQAAIAHQIKDRTRSQLMYDEVGFPVETKPEGAAGWDAMRNFSDQLESGYGYENVKRGVDAAVPDVSGGGMSLPPSYQIWGRGYGVNIDQDTTEGFTGYDANIAGGMLGVDKRVENVLFGLGGGYAHSELSGFGGKDGKADTGNLVGYLATHGRNAHLNASVNYAYNSVDTKYSPLGYTGSYDAHTIGLFAGGGYGIALCQDVVFTPELSVLATHYSRGDYKEKSSLGLPTRKFDAHDQWSCLTTIGATLSLIKKLEVARWEMGVQPELRAHWLHESKADPDSESYVLVGGSGSTFNAALMPREEDMAKLGGGVRISKWASDATEFGIDFDGVLGADYTAYTLSGKLIHRF